GTFVTPFIPGKFRPTPLRLDGTRYGWTLTYDPEANGGGGRFQFTIKNHGTEPEPLEASRLPADLPAAHKHEALSPLPESPDLPRGPPRRLQEGRGYLRPLWPDEPHEAGKRHDDLLWRGPARRDHRGLYERPRVGRLKKPGGDRERPRGLAQLRL